MRALPISGEYPPNWSEIGDRVRAEAGHRCIRCGHPYRTGQHGKGEWSPCDEGCRHAGPLGYFMTAAEVEPIYNESVTVKEYLSPSIAKRIPGPIVARWRILTVHHMDGNKANCAWWNLLSLCQRCHLTIQCKVNPEIPYFLEHSAWAKPYVAGFYAKKYLGQDLSRPEVEGRLEELLKLELLA